MRSQQQSTRRHTYRQKTGHPRHTIGSGCGSGVRDFREVQSVHAGTQVMMLGGARARLHAHTRLGRNQPRNVTSSSHHHRKTRRPMRVWRTTATVKTSTSMSPSEARELDTSAHCTHTRAPNNTAHTHMQNATSVQLAPQRITRIFAPRSVVENCHHSIAKK